MSFEPKIISDDDPRDESRRNEVSGLQAEGAVRVERQPDPVWDDSQALGLSDDLALLAEQLVVDANFLARRHPADATPQQRAAAVAGGAAAVQPAAMQPGAPHRSLRQFSWASAAAAILVVAGIASLVWNANQNNQQVGQPAGGVATQIKPPHTAALAGSKTPANELGIEIAPRVRTLRTGLPVEEPVANPTEFLRGVSGPELDGMLDLLPPEETGLSI
jgi:hypothetical protein